MRGSQLNLNCGISWDSRVSRRWRGPLSVAHSKRRGNAIERFVVDVADSKVNSNLVRANKPPGRNQSILHRRC